MTKTKMLRSLLFITALSAFFITGCQRADLSLPDTGIILYAAAYSDGIYKSDNGGKSWYPLPANQESIRLYFKNISVSPDTRTMYIATTGAGMFRLDLTEEALNRVDLLRHENVKAVKFYNPAPEDKDSRHVVLAGTAGQGIFSLGSDGSELQSLNAGLTYRDVNTFLVCPENELYAGTRRDVFKWNISRNSWVSVSEGIKNKNIFSMACNPEDGTLYAGAGAYDEEKGLVERFIGRFPSLYKSTDNGRSWTKSDRGISKGALVYDIKINPRNPDKIYIGTSDGIYLSTNRGSRWRKLDKGLPDELRVFDIEIVSMDNDTSLVYAATSRGVYAAIDNRGAPWIHMSYGLPSTNITSLVLLKE